MRRFASKANSARRIVSHRALTAVAFNGQAAGRFATEFAAAGFRTTVLPSSSPAHAGRSFDQKLAVWRAWWAVSPS